MQGSPQREQRVERGGSTAGIPQSNSTVPICRLLPFSRAARTVASSKPCASLVSMSILMVTRVPGLALNRPTIS